MNHGIMIQYTNDVVYVVPQAQNKRCFSLDISTKVLVREKLGKGWCCVKMLLVTSQVVSSRVISYE